MSLRSSNNIKIEGGMSSMTDLVFLLLIFFIILAVEYNPTYSVKVNLPQGGTVTDKNTEAVSISVDVDNVIYLNGDQIKFENLEDQLLVTLKGDKEKSIVISSDEKASFGTAAKVIDLLKKNDLTKVAISMKK